MFSFLQGEEGKGGRAQFPLPTGLLTARLAVCNLWLNACSWLYVTSFQQPKTTKNTGWQEAWHMLAVLCVFVQCHSNMQPQSELLESGLLEHTHARTRARTHA